LKRIKTKLKDHNVPGQFGALKMTNLGKQI